MTKFNEYLEAVQDEDFEPIDEYDSFFEYLNENAEKQLTELMKAMKALEKEYMIKHNITLKEIKEMKNLIMERDDICDPSTIAFIYCIRK